MPEPALERMREAFGDDDPRRRSIAARLARL